MKLLKISILVAVMAGFTSCAHHCKSKHEAYKCDGSKQCQLKQKKCDGCKNKAHACKGKKAEDCKGKKKEACKGKKKKCHSEKKA